MPSTECGNQRARWNRKSAERDWQSRRLFRPDARWLKPRGCRRPPIAHCRSRLVRTPWERRRFFWKDDARGEPNTPDEHDRRELRVDVWYPAECIRHRRTGRVFSRS